MLTTPAIDEKNLRDRKVFHILFRFYWVTLLIFSKTSVLRSYADINLNLSPALLPEINIADVVVTSDGVVVTGNKLISGIMESMEIRRTRHECGCQVRTSAITSFTSVNTKLRLSPRIFRGL